MEGFWAWKLEDNGGYAIKSTYKLLEGFLIVEENLSVLEEVFGCFQKILTPFKVVDFS